MYIVFVPSLTAIPTGVSPTGISILGKFKPPVGVSYMEITETVLETELATYILVLLLLSSL